MGAEAIRAKHKTHRLLAAVLRAAADQAAEVATDELESAYAAGSRERMFFYEAARIRVRAAVLSSGSRRKGERR